MNKKLFCAMVTQEVVLKTLVLLVNMFAHVFMTKKSTK